MNVLSLQVVTWGMVSTAVSTAVWLAMLGDATLLGSPERTLATTPAKPDAQRPIRPVVFHPATPPRLDSKPLATPVRPHGKS